MNIQDLIKDEIGSIVDVRTEGEFEMGNVDGSINIPMHEVTQRIDELKTLPQPLVLICLSGNRSGQVMNYLRSLGMEEVYNGGGWYEVKEMKNAPVNKQQIR